MLRGTTKSHGIRLLFVSLPLFFCVFAAALAAPLVSAADAETPMLRRGLKFGQHVAEADATAAPTPGAGCFIASTDTAVYSESYENCYYACLGAYGSAATCCDTAEVFCASDDSEPYSCLELSTEKRVSKLRSTTMGLRAPIIFAIADENIRHHVLDATAS